MKKQNKIIIISLVSVLTLITTITIAKCIATDNSKDLFTDEKIKNILPSYENNEVIYSSSGYSLHVSLVDEHSPDRILSLYKNEEIIKFKEIRYTDGTLLCNYKNPAVSVFDLDDESLDVILENNEKINIKLNNSN